MKQRLVISGLIVLGLLFAGFFGARAFHAVRHIRLDPGSLSPPANESTDVELIRNWMTIPYIARTYGVSDRILFEELNIPSKDNLEKSLKELNEEYYPDKDGYILDEVKKAVALHGASTPPSSSYP